MKVVARGEVTPVLLVEGDRVTCSISHQLRIGREETWVRYEAQTVLGASESHRDAEQRVVEAVNHGVHYAIDQAVSAVQARSTT